MRRVPKQGLPCTLKCASQSQNLNIQHRRTIQKYQCKSKRYFVGVNAQRDVNNEELGLNGVTSEDDLKQQIQQAKKEEDSARRHREMLEIRLLHHAQEEARIRLQKSQQLSEARKAAVKIWQRRNVQNENSEDMSQQSSAESSTTAADSQVANNYTNNQTNQENNLPAASPFASQEGTPLTSNGQSKPSTPFKKRSRGAKKKNKWSRYSVTASSSQSTAPQPAQPSITISQQTAPAPEIEMPTEATSNTPRLVPSSGPPSLDDLVEPLERAYVSHTDTFDDELCALPKPIFVVSDCTGESAARTVRCALGQFEQFMQASCPANLVIYRFISNERKAYDIMKQASDEDALVVYTVVDGKLVKALRTAAKLQSVKCVDLWGPLLDNMEHHLQANRSGVPLGTSQQRPKLSPDYFRMIEAVEYTRKMDDGASPSNWKEADLLILGVSRSGKTPLSIYLGQRGFKVANLPLVAGIPPPKQLYEIEQCRVIGLTIDAQVLCSMRHKRKKLMGVGNQSNLSYDQMKTVQQELKWAKDLYGANPQWPVLDVTYRGVEETAARILRIMGERLGHTHAVWNSARQL